MSASNSGDADTATVYRATLPSRVFHWSAMLIGVLAILAGPFLVAIDPRLGAWFVVWGIAGLAGSLTTITEVSIAGDRCTLRPVVGRSKVLPLGAIQVRHRRFHGILPSHWVQGRLTIVTGCGWRWYVLAGPMFGFEDLLRRAPAM